MLHTLLAVEEEGGGSPPPCTTCPATLNHLPPPPPPHSASSSSAYLRPSATPVSSTLASQAARSSLLKAFRPHPIAILASRTVALEPSSPPSPPFPPPPTQIWGDWPVPRRPPSLPRPSGRLGGLNPRPGRSGGGFWLGLAPALPESPDLVRAPSLVARTCSPAFAPRQLQSEVTCPPHQAFAPPDLGWVAADRPPPRVARSVQWVFRSGSGCPDLAVVSTDLAGQLVPAPCSRLPPPVLAGCCSSTTRAPACCCPAQPVQRDPARASSLPARARSCRSG